MKNLPITPEQLTNLTNVKNELKRFKNATLGRMQNRCESEHNIEKKEVSIYVDLLIAIGNAEIVECQGGDGWNTSYKYEEIKFIK